MLLLGLGVPGLLGQWKGGRCLICGRSDVDELYAEPLDAQA